MSTEDVFLVVRVGSCIEKATRLEAEKEARELCKGTPLEYYVLQAVSITRTPSPRPKTVSLSPEVFP